jgi:hypothetical protein
MLLATFVRRWRKPAAGAPPVGVFLVSGVRLLRRLNFVGDGRASFEFWEVTNRRWPADGCARAFVRA